MPTLDTIVVEVIVRGPQGPQVPDGDKGDITVSSNGTVWEIDAGAVGTGELATNAVTTAKITDANVTAAKLATDAVETAKIKDANVTNAKLDDMAAATIKGRAAGAGTGAPVDLTATQATAILDEFTSSLKGLAPASGGGTTNFLRADGEWAEPPGTGGGGGIADAPSDGVAYVRRNAGWTSGDSRFAAASHTHAAADVTSGTLDIARLPVATSGTSNSTQVVRADDSRLSDTRTPTDNTVTTAKITDANVTNAKLANMNANTVKARAANSSGVPSDVALAASQILGRGSTGDVAAITLGSGLTMSGTTLSASGGGGGSAPDYQAFTSSGTWTKPSGLTGSELVLVELWGGGGGGRQHGTDSNAHGGGGGEYRQIFMRAAELSSTESVTVGAGGTGGSSATNGGASSFKGIQAAGGVGPTISAVPYGGGTFSGHARSVRSGSPASGQLWLGGSDSAVVGLSSVACGGEIGGLGAYTDFTTDLTAQNTVNSGGGGGGAHSNRRTGGTSARGGAGGTSTGTTGAAGSAPGGGGAGGTTTAGNGARGEVRVTVISS